MAKVLTPTKKSKKQRDNTQQKRHHKVKFHNDFRTDLERLVGVTTAIQLVWLNQFTGSQPSHLPQKLCNQKDIHKVNVNILR